jgi:glutamate 5-kinase
MNRGAITSAKRVVIKIGSSSLTGSAGSELDPHAVQKIADLAFSLKKRGAEVVLVSSGAIAAGLAPLGLKARPKDLATQQAAASVGQGLLIAKYNEAFTGHGVISSQVLITTEDIVRRSHYQNAQQTLSKLLSLGVIPIINENDTVVTDEIKFGDNDSLAALVSNLIHADLLVILTDQGGLYTADPRQNADATLLTHAIAGDPALEKMAGGAASELSKGGMLTKVLAAKIAAQTDTSTVIASGREPNVLTRLLAGEKIGTHLSSTENS